MKEELISVIVPIYKVEKYLKVCIDSIINQSYKNLEIILIDDGSPDNCGKMCDEYAKKDNRIKVIHKENGGLSSARNAGLDIATGEYISFIDSDDAISSNFIEYLHNLCKKNKVDISVCSIQRFDCEIDIKEAYTEKEELKFETAREMSRRVNGRNSLPSTVVWNKLYKRYIYENLRFPVGKIIEDQFTTYKAYDICKTNIVISNFELYYYRVNPTSILGVKFNKKRLDILEAYEERIEFYREKKDKELLNKTLAGYQHELKSCFINVYNNLDNNKEILKDLNKKLKCNYKELIKNNGLKLEKLNLTIFTFMPFIACYFWPYLKSTKEFIKNIKFEIFRLLGGRHVVISSPEHGNLGDQAITIAQNEILKSLKIKYFEVAMKEREDFIYYMAQRNYKDIVFLVQGGGNFCNQWSDYYNIRNVVRNFPNNKIIIFPQTIYWIKADMCNVLEDEAKELCNTAKDLTICCREEYSYKYAKENYKNAKILLVPDIVFNLNVEQPKKERKGCLMIFRDDEEKKVEKEIVLEMKKILKKRFSKVTSSSMDEHGYIYKDTREQEVRDKLEEFQGSELVVTDRLHGMIFAAITNTPCIVFSNTNHKIKGVYEKWLSKYDWIRFMSDKEIEKIDKEIEIAVKEKNSINNVDSKLFQQFIKILENSK